MHRSACAIGLLPSVLLLVALLALDSGTAQPITPLTAATATLSADANNERIGTQYANDDGDDATALESQANADDANSPTQFKIPLLPGQDQNAESVKLETEALQSKVLSAYDNSQQKVADLTDPLPILDTISEHEKYGNQGDMFDGISRTIVNGYEAFSNFLNHIIQRPKEVARSISRGITAQLDVIGGKLVGL